MGQVAADGRDGLRRLQRPPPEVRALRRRPCHRGRRRRRLRGTAAVLHLRVPLHRTAPLGTNSASCAAALCPATVTCGAAACCARSWRDGMVSLWCARLVYCCWFSVAVIFWNLCRGTWVALYVSVTTVRHQNPPRRPSANTHTYTHTHTHTHRQTRCGCGWAGARTGAGAARMLGCALCGRWAAAWAEAGSGRCLRGAVEECGRGRGGVGASSMVTNDAWLSSSCAAACLAFLNSAPSTQRGTALVGSQTSSQCMTAGVMGWRERCRTVGACLGGQPLDRVLLLQHRGESVWMRVPSVGGECVHLYHRIEGAIPYVTPSLRRPIHMVTPLPSPRVLEPNCPQPNHRYRCPIRITYRQRSIAAGVCQPGRDGCAPVAVTHDGHTQRAGRGLHGQEHPPYLWVPPCWPSPTASVLPQRC